jgi:cysteine desulfurase/selenocysteine lyase
MHRARRRAGTACLKAFCLQSIAVNAPLPTPTDPATIRLEFPALRQEISGRPLIYLDNAATTQKPQSVIDAMGRFYSHDNANIHRAVHELSRRATEAYESARQEVARFIGAESPEQVIFTRGTTESINLVAGAWCGSNLRAGDEIVLTTMEHHSNIVPWQLAAQRVGARVLPARVDDAGELDLEHFAGLLSERTRVVAFVHVSNSLGTVNPVRELVSLARRLAPKAIVLVDGAQWVAHGSTRVTELGCDFYCFSGHKLYGPTGVGVLYGRRSVLESMPPWQGGGDMIETVSFAGTTFAGLPNRFEAGTPNIAGVVGLAEAIRFVDRVGLSAAASHEAELVARAVSGLREVAGVRLVGTPRVRVGVASFLVEGLSALDAGVELNRKGIAVRIGHHCCMPLMEAMGVDGTIRASFAVYNTLAEVEQLVAAVAELAAGARQGDSVPPVIAGSTASTQTSAKSELTFAPPAAESVVAAADALATEFELLPTREDRGQYLLDLGQRLEHQFDQLKRLTQRVPGCMAEVYLVGRVNDLGRFEFAADANAQVVRGLIAMLQRLFSGQPREDVLAFDIEAFFRRIGLDQFITSQRRNGLAGMIALIRRLAAGKDGLHP